MNQRPGCTWRLIFGSAFLLFLLLASACDGSDSDPAADDDDDGSHPETLVFTLNAGDRVRDGFDSKDSWHLEFDHVYINLQGPTAFQVEQDLTEGNESDDVEATRLTAKLVHAGHPHAEIPDGTANEALLGEFFMDGAKGENPSELGRVEDVPIGNYNYMNFNILPAGSQSEGLVADYEGYSLVLIGTASNNEDHTLVAFKLMLTETLEFTSCGPHQETEAVVAEGGEGTAEIALRFETLFGDKEEGSAEPEDEDAVNSIAIGFDPFAALATDGSLTMTQTELQAMPEYSSFLDALRSIGSYGHSPCNCTGAAEGH